jgi:hypothetical protein
VVSVALVHHKYAVAGEIVINHRLKSLVISPN